MMLDNLLNHVILNVTEDCNNRCGYCKYSGEYIYSRTHNEKYMEKAVAIRAVRFMIERSNYILKNTDQNCSVGFYGGEPLLNLKVIKDCVNYINEYFCSIRDRINFSMTTNLTVLNEEMLDFLVRNDFSLLVSLDGPEEIHDRYRRSRSGKGTFSMVRKNLNRIKVRNEEYYKNKVGFSIVLAPPYDLNSILKFFEQEDYLTKKVLFLSFVDPEDTNFFARFKDLDKINEEVNEQLGKLKMDYKRLVIAEERESPKYKLLSSFFEERVRDVYRRHLIPLPERIYPNGICLPGVQKFLVSPEGKFYICEKIGYSFPIGDVYRGFDIEGIFFLIDEYIRISEPMCLSCWAVRFCKACFLRAMEGERLDPERKKENCSDIKNSICNGLKLFSEIMERNPKALDYLKETKFLGVIDVAFKFAEEYRNSISSTRCAGSLI